MPLLLWGGVAAAGIAASAWAVDEAGQAMDSAARLTCYALAAGALYVGYRALKHGGAL